jgi:hypothetical protein
VIGSGDVIDGKTVLGVDAPNHGAVSGQNFVCHVRLNDPSDPTKPHDAIYMATPTPSASQVRADAGLGRSDNAAK